MGVEAGTSPHNVWDTRWMDGEPISTFSTWDYVVFGSILLISSLIGVYHAVAGGGQQTTTDFLIAGRSMSALPVALSVLASFFSASTLLGTPAEIYLRGTMYWMSVFGAIIAPFIGAFVFGPFFYKLKVVSVFEVMYLSTFVKDNSYFFKQNSCIEFAWTGMWSRGQCSLPMIHLRIYRKWNLCRYNRVSCYLWNIR